MYVNWNHLLREIMHSLSDIDSHYKLIFIIIRSYIVNLNEKNYEVALIEKFLYPDAFGIKIYQISF